jgi:hypothetical protein
MLPTHGMVSSVFYLSHSIRDSTYPDMAAWVRAAGNRSSFLSAAIDHLPAAHFLVESNLVSVEGEIRPSRTLRALSRQADRSTLIAIASVVLNLAPPPWLGIAVGAKVRYEFIPTADLQGLEWLRPELDQLLLDANDRRRGGSNLLALGIGRAAELAIFAALERKHRSPVHVSEISDRFGYDIETSQGGVGRWEVKGCTEATSASFHLSRNEFEKSQLHSKDWTLIQVQFASAALTSDFVTGLHVAAIRELPPRALRDLIPANSATFYWEASARITPPGDAWLPSALTVPDELCLPTFTELGKHALEGREELPTR